MAKDDTISRATKINLCFNKVGDKTLYCWIGNDGKRYSPLVDDIEKAYLTPIEEPEEPKIINLKN
jgi:hypothetical protein